MYPCFQDLSVTLCEGYFFSVAEINIFVTPYIRHTRRKSALSFFELAPGRSNPAAKSPQGQGMTLNCAAG